MKIMDVKRLTAATAAAKSTGQTLLAGCLLTSSALCFASERELEIHLSASISERCHIEVTPLQGTRMDFSTRIENTAALAINCNLPMALKVRSQWGALVNSDKATQLGRGFMIDSRVDQQLFYRTYQTDISIASLGFRATSSSQALRSARVFNTGGKIPFRTAGLLRVRLDAPLTFSGRYEDVLHLEVSPSHGTGGI